MTVKELITQLQQEDPDMLVYMQGSEWDEPVENLKHEVVKTTEWREVSQLDILGGGTVHEPFTSEIPVVLLI